MLITSGDAVSGDWSRRLLAEWFGLAGTGLDVANYVIRKTAHLAYYGALAALLAHSLVTTLSSRTRRAAVVGVLLAVATGVFDETRQALHESRTASAWDVLYDAVGATIAAWVYTRRAEGK